MRILHLGLTVIVSLWLISCQKVLVRTTTNVDKSLTSVEVEKQDESVNQFIEPYKKQLDAEMNSVIGTCPIELIEADYQSPLGNFIIDLILYQSEKTFSKKIDMAVVTNGGLRTPMPKGDVTIGNIFELMPFNNEIVILELKGEAVLKMMKYGAERGNAVFAGVTYKVKNGQAEDIIISGKPLEYENVYTLALSDYLAGGGDKMTFLTESVKTHQLGILFRDAIINHIKELTADGKEIVGKLDDRVIIVE